MAQIPISLQGVFWSVDTTQLDTQKNKSYIIHQILAFGTLDDIRWLFKTYDRSTITDVFLRQPMKLYTPAAFHFSKLMLDITDAMAPSNRYDKTLPRYIG